MSRPRSRLSNVLDSSSETRAVTPWEGDLLNRKAHADFLTRYLTSRIMAIAGPVSFTVALNAAWGQGKTYFVQNWSKSLDAQTPRYPSFVFDAWAADYAADPVLAFMAALKTSLDAEIARSTLGVKAKATLQRGLDDAIKSARRAIWPAVRTIGKALVKKATGVVVDEVVDAIEGEAISDTPDAPEDLSADALEALDAGLDEFFKKALASHAERSKSIIAFRTLVEATIVTLAQGKTHRLPMFVFVDELDRCRPSFAIALLEGIKHLFGVPGVCFVISLNLTQLSHSVKAVYGEGFDGYRYLKRFFDIEVALPIAAGPSYAKQVLAEYAHSLRQKMQLGLPESMKFEGWDATPATALAWVAENFDLNLRSQRQIMEMCVAAASGIRAESSLYFLWLLSLCAIRHLSPEEFERLADSVGKEAGIHNTIWRDLSVASVSRQFRDPSDNRAALKQVRLVEVAYQYHQAANADLKTFDKLLGNMNIYDYPRSVLVPVKGEAPHAMRIHDPYPTSLKTYFDLVRSAGHVAVSGD